MSPSANEEYIFNHQFHLQLLPRQIYPTRPDLEQSEHWEELLVLLNGWKLIRKQWNLERIKWWSEWSKKNRPIHKWWKDCDKKWERIELQWQLREQWWRQNRQVVDNFFEEIETDKNSFEEQEYEWECVLQFRNYEIALLQDSPIETFYSIIKYCSIVLVGILYTFCAIFLISNNIRRCLLN